LYATAALAGLALAAGDAAAATRKAPTVTHNTAVRAVHTRPTRAATTQQRFHTVARQQHTNKLSNTQQRFHKVTTTPTNTTHPTRTTHFGQGTTPSHAHNPSTLTHATFKHGPARLTAVGPKHSTFPTIKLGNRVAPIWKSGPKRIWVGGHWKVFAAFSAIHVVRIGARYYWPDAYVNVGRPYCTGTTPDGCQLNWQLVNFEDGGNAYQCVQFCPRPNAPPPQDAVALTPPPPVPAAGACEVTVYSEPNFAGQDATTGEEQPALSQTGWQDQIVSVQVKSGVWDFFSEENFGGNNMRLRPGSYQDLGPEWSKKINSFMCVMAVPPGTTAAQ
jgi:hypothetical protein